MRTVSADTLMDYVGRELTPTEWFRVEQSGVDLFADATLDHQAIHVDPKAARSSVYGSTIAHGFYMLSLTSHWLFEQLVTPEGTEVFINYGLDRVRFISPVKVGSEVRLRTVLKEVQEKGDGSYLMKVSMTLEIKGEDRPGMVADMLMLLLPPKAPNQNG